jgi:hypothetical protein
VYDLTANQEVNSAHLLNILGRIIPSVIVQNFRFQDDFVGLAGMCEEKEVGTCA